MATSIESNSPGNGTGELSLQTVASLCPPRDSLRACGNDGLRYGFYAASCAESNPLRLNRSTCVIFGPFGNVLIKLTDVCTIRLTTDLRDEIPQTVRLQAEHYFGSLRNAIIALKKDQRLLRSWSKPKIINVLSRMHRCKRLRRSRPSEPGMQSDASNMGPFITQRLVVRSFFVRTNSFKLGHYLNSQRHSVAAKRFTVGR